MLASSEMFKDILLTFRPPTVGQSIFDAKSRLTGKLLTTSAVVSVANTASTGNLDPCFVVTTASGSRYVVMVLPQSPRQPATPYPTHRAGPLPQGA